MLWWLLLFTTPLFSDDFAAERYCFASEGRRASIERELKGILVPSDVVTPAGECLTVQMRPHRRELIQSFVRRLDASAQVSFSSAELQREPCRLRVEKTDAASGERVGARVGETVGAGARTDSSRGNETFSIQTLKDFELSVDQDRVQGSCRRITPERYEVSLTVARDRRPLHPPVPPGSVVVLTTPPPDEQTSQLTTTVQLARGERLELGGLVRELREKNQKIDLESGVRVENEKAVGRSRVFLLIEP